MWENKQKTTYKEALKSGIQPKNRSQKAKILTINSSCYIDGWINDLDFNFIPVLYHRASSDYFAKPLKKKFLSKLHQID